MNRADRSGPLHLGGTKAAEPATPLVQLPALAIIASHMGQRPLWQSKTSFAVPSELYEAGRGEMQEQMKKRGFPLAVDKNLEQDGVEHFLYLGTPIMVERGQ